MQISNRFGGQGVPGWKEDYGPEPNCITDAEDDLPGESGRDAALTWTTSKTSGLFTQKANGPSGNTARYWTTSFATEVQVNGSEPPVGEYARRGIE